MDKLKNNPLSIVRIVIGLLFAGHGVSKFLNFAGTTSFFASIGFPVWIAVVVSILEIIIGISLIINFKTKIASYLMIVILLTAIFKVKLKSGLFGGYELDLLYITAAVAIIMDSCKRHPKPVIQSQSME
jgi:putative oxidoreductase